MDRASAKEYILMQSPEVFLPRAKKKGFVCPVPGCKNGTGRDGDGITKMPNKNTYHCFKCGFSGDIFELIGQEFGLPNFNDQFNKACELYGVSVDRYSSSTVIQNKSEEIIHSVVEQDQNVEKYVSECHARIKDCDYLIKRGLSQATIDRFNIGYDPDYGKEHWKAIIIPTSTESYSARNINVEPNSQDMARYKYRKKGHAHLFNGSVLQTEKEQPIFVVEGEIDAMSIVDAGAQAIGLGSTSNYNLLLTELDKVTPQKPLILALDTDNAGKEGMQRLEDGLKAKKIAFMEADKDFLAEYHDPNDRLMKDRDGFTAAIRNTESIALSLPSPADEAREEYLKTSVSRSMNALKEAIEKAAALPNLSTGFTSIDTALDGGLHTGFYIIGAISSLGKTTLALQIADNLAKQGRDVLFFSLEQSKYELMCKSISRETFIYCRINKIDTKNAKSNLGIFDGSRWKNYNEKEMDVLKSAWNKYADYSKHLFIHEGIGNISVDQIRGVVKDHISFTGNKRPIIFIDYLQILKAADGDERCTDKQIVDHNVTALKQLSRDFDIPIFAVSSFNRTNYSEEVNMAAFKESGAIEYGSDVLIGLQLHGAGDKDFDVNEAKMQNPRNVDFCILKNRNGKINTKGIQLSYYTTFNCFLDNNVTFSETDNKTKVENNNVKDDSEFITVTGEDIIPFID